MVRDSAQQFAADSSRPGAGGFSFMASEADPAIFREMGETGLLSATIPDDTAAAV
jgi:glutaryl-CoA dehydrogenase